MKIKLTRKVSEFSSKAKDYGKVVIVSEELASYIGKEIEMEIDIIGIKEVKL